MSSFNINYFNFSERIKNVGAQRPIKMPHLSADALSIVPGSPPAKAQAKIEAMIETNPATKNTFDNIISPYYFNY